MIKVSVNGILTLHVFCLITECFEEARPKPGGVRGTTRSRCIAQTGGQNARKYPPKLLRLLFTFPGVSVLSQGSLHSVTLFPKNVPVGSIGERHLAVFNSVSTRQFIIYNILPLQSTAGVRFGEQSSGILYLHKG